MLRDVSVLGESAIHGPVKEINFHPKIEGINDIGH
jgi:hypothetical protein